MPNINKLTLVKMAKFLPNNARKRDFVGLESTCVASLDYQLLDEENGTLGTLTVVFHQRGTYKYFEFPLDDYVDFTMASSQGQYFNLYIRDKGYRYERVN